MRTRSEVDKATAAGPDDASLRRALPPRAPEPSAARLKMEADRGRYLEAREGAERRSVLRGLVAIVLLLLIFAWLRAGTDRAFYTGWWQQW